MASTTLRSYIDTYRVTSADFNISGLGGGWSGTYKIPEDEYESIFLPLVYDHHFVKDQTCSLLERHKPVMSPIVIDLDFKYASGKALHRRFSQEHLREFVAAYANAVARFVEPTTHFASLQFFVSLKPAPEADPARDQHKDGIHIMCPNITVSRDKQCAIRGYLLQTGVIERIFTGITNQPQECLDLSVIRPLKPNSWFLYGACKPDKQWYKLEHVYEYTLPDDQLVSDVTAEDLVELTIDQWGPRELTTLLSIRHNHDMETPIIIRADRAEEWSQLLQIYSNGKNVPGKASISQKQLSQIQQKEIVTHEEVVCSSGTVRAPLSPDDISLAYRLIRECLNPVVRAKTYSDWVALGLLIHNISPSDTSLSVWKEFSRRVSGCANTSDSVYESKWNFLPAKQHGRNLLMTGTLHRWAKEDSPALYRAIMRESNITLAYLNHTGSHVSIAELILRMYKNEFRCSPPKKGASASQMDWYQYPVDEHAWKSKKTGMHLRERLSNEVRDMFLGAIKQSVDMEMKSTDESERVRIKKKRDGLEKVAEKLQNTTFKDCVLKESVEKFYDEEIVGCMNMNPSIVGFSNGVLDLRSIGPDGQVHVHFRPGRPDDFISFQMGGKDSQAIPYIPYDPENPEPEHLEVLDFFKLVYPNDELREYVWTLDAACLEGANREQKFYIFTGKQGSNGKSKHIKLMSETFGNYSTYLQSTVVTRKRPESGAANPDLIKLKCKRYVSMSEVSVTDKIHSDIMKQMSGEDVIQARGLFQDQDEFVVMARIFMLCNDLPQVDSTDGGTWRRLRVIPHVAKFVDPDDVSYDPTKYIFYKDLMLEEKITRWRPYFAGILVWYFENRYLRGGLKEPAMVLAASNKYKEDNDVFAAFSNECIVKEIGCELKVSQLLKRYTDWSKFNPGKKILNKDEIKVRLTEQFGTPIEGRIYMGIRLTLEDEDASGNLVSH